MNKRTGKDGKPERRHGGNPYPKQWKTLINYKKSKNIKIRERLSSPQQKDSDSRRTGPKKNG